MRNDAEYIKLCKMCAIHRKKLGITQKEVARELGYSPENICAFEHGKTRNALILAWYVRNGLRLDNIMGRV